MAWGTRPLGAALGAVLGEWLGVRSVFLVMGVVTATVLIPNRTITERGLAEAEAREAPGGRRRHVGLSRRWLRGRQQRHVEQAFGDRRSQGRGLGRSPAGSCGDSTSTEASGRW